MAYHKRRIIEVFFPFEDEDRLHPAVILSVPQVFHEEGYYLCAMITSSKVRDEFSFPLSDADTAKPLRKPSQVRLQLIGQIYKADINKAMPINELTTDCFERLISHIEERVFAIPSYDDTGL